MILVNVLRGGVRQRVSRGGLRVFSAPRPGAVEFGVCHNVLPAGTALDSVRERSRGVVGGPAPGTVTIVETA